MTTDLTESQPILSLRERKKLAQKEHIFVTTLRLFQMQGYDLTTVDAICQEAQVARQTFFNYFPRKDSVLSYWGERKLLQLQEAFARRRRFPTRLKEQIGWVFGQLVQGYQEERDLLRIVVFEILRSAPAMAEDRVSRQALGHLLEQLCREAGKRGELPAHVQPDRLTGILQSLYFYGFLEWLEAEQPYSLLNELLRRLDVLWQGIGPGERSR